MVKDINCPQAYCDTEEIEQAILSDVFRFALEVQSMNDTSSSGLFDTSELEKNIDSVDAQIKRLYRLYAADPDETLLETLDELKEKRQKMQDKLTKMQSEDSRRVAHKEIKETIDNLENIWNFLSIDEQRNILHIIIESVVITDDQINIHYRI